MDARVFYNDLLVASFVMAAIVFFVLFFMAAPYGRHIRKGWGPTLGNKASWVLMEAPSPLIFAACFLAGDNKTIVTIVFLLLWEAHYIHRAFIYPFSLRGDRHMPLLVIGFGLIFNIMNAYLNGTYIFTFSSNYTNNWLIDPRFIGGLALFATGFLINRSADQTLRNLREPGEDVYKIPQTGLYRWISCPNYFGEIVIWTGWAVATWSLPGLAFAVWTMANLAPRARSHHAWYQEYFEDYPPERKALVPKVW
jgi:protein-S-isoprenylcysteine O-methyltransferase Ste14